MRFEVQKSGCGSIQVTNQDVLRRIERESQGCEDLPNILRFVRRSLRLIGTKVRYGLAEGETPLSIALDVYRKAVIEARGPIDYVLFVGVCSPVVEPTSAAMFASRLGVGAAHTLDLRAACGGLTEGLEYAEMLFQTGRAQRALILTAEFPNATDYLDKSYRISSLGELAHRMPAFTIGGAATATIVAGQVEDTPWKFRHAIDNNVWDFCSVMASWYRPEVGSSTLVAVDGPGKFVSWAAKLSERGIPLAIEAFNKLDIRPEDVDIVFCHSSGSKDWIEIATELGVVDKLFDVHPCDGNLVAATIALAMVKAEKEERLHRGDRVVILVASAGMFATAVYFVY